jgi:hypothetical protein
VTTFSVIVSDSLGQWSLTDTENDPVFLVLQVPAGQRPTIERAIGTSSRVSSVIRICKNSMPVVPSSSLKEGC